MSNPFQLPQITENASSAPHPLIVGMLHLPPLPGSPGYEATDGKRLDAIREFVLNDAESLVNPKNENSEAGGGGGVDAVMLENFGDTPFFAGRVPTETVAAMTVLARDVRQYLDEKAGRPVPLGINVLRNDALSAIAIAAAVGADMIRVNVLSGAMMTDQGLITGQAAELLRYRKQLDANHIQIWADVRVKHAAPIVERDLQDEVEELVHRAGADALIVSGSGTGKPTDLTELQSVRQLLDQCAPNTPVLVGSGVNAQSAKSLAQHATGLIVGSSLKPNHQLDQPIDPHAVANLMSSI